MKKSFYSILTAILLLLTPMEESVGAEVLDRVVARVNDDLILLSDIHIRIKQVTGGKSAKELDSEERNFLSKKIIEGMVEERLIVDFAKDRGGVISDEEINKMVDKVKRQANLTDEQLNGLLERDGINIEEYRQVLHDQRLVSLVLNQEVQSKVFIKDSEIEAYYDANKKDYEAPVEVHARHILITSPSTYSREEKNQARKRAEAILEKLKKGADFIETAKEYSEDSSRSVGGDLGFFGRGRMIPQFEKTAFSLKEGEISDVVETPFGFHIIKAVERRRIRGKSKEEAFKEIEAFLYGGAVEERKKAFIGRLRETALVEMKL